MAAKRMTAREKKLRAQAKKRLQAEEIIPPDKPRLNRKKFIEEAKAEWNSRVSGDVAIWDGDFAEAMAIMLAHRESSSGRASLEAVGAAKVLKLAVRMSEFKEKVMAEGRKQYTTGEMYEYIKDILEA